MLTSDISVMLEFRSTILMVLIELDQLLNLLINKPYTTLVYIHNGYCGLRSFNRLGQVGLSQFRADRPNNDGQLRFIVPGSCPT